MTDEEHTLLMIRGTIAGMSEDDQIRIKAIASTLRNVLATGGNHAQMAFALVGAEQAASP
jgi:translation initiation factor 1 (eIF-1/SUI1)